MKSGFIRIAGAAAVWSMVALGGVACDSGDDTSGGGDASVADTGGTTDTGGGTTDTGGGTTDTGGGTTDTGGGTTDTGGGTTDTGGGTTDTGGGTTDTGGTADTGGTTDTATPPVEEGMVCGQVMLCALACDKTDAACLNACIGGAKNEAEGAEFSTLLDCYTANCSMETGDDLSSCLMDKCADSYDACTAGDGTCAHIWYCDLMCGSADCRDGCGYLGDGAAQGQFEALQSCLGGKCPAPITQSCRLDKVSDAASCKSQAEACAPAGTKTCIAVFDDCVIPCEGNDACIYACLGQAKLHDQLAAARYWACLEQSCGTTPDFACKDFAKNHDCSSQHQDCTGL